MRGLVTVAALRAALAFFLGRDRIRRTTPATSCWPQKWDGYPGPYTCGNCGWVTCPDCMRAGMDCGVCTHPCNPVIVAVLQEAWEKGESVRTVEIEGQEP